MASSVSAWVARFASLVPSREAVLDVACGSGRHTRFFLERGHRVVAVDRDVAGIADLRRDPALEVIEVDLEEGAGFALRGRRFGGVVVTNYLHRPILGDLVDVVAEGGALIYETFSDANAALGPPRRPEFLLRPGELIEAVRGRLRVVAYEDLVVDDPRPAAVQRIAAVRDRP